MCVLVLVHFTPGLKFQVSDLYVRGRSRFDLLTERPPLQKNSTTGLVLIALFGLQSRFRDKLLGI